MEPLVHTKSGPVRGHIRDGIASFLGIPYAASPTGELRFAAPVPHEPWTDVLDATTFGPTPPKPAYPAPFDTLLEEPDIPGEEWLNLNVWTPAERSGDLPVMVWIHGGAFANGNSAVPWYDGRSFAKAGVVLVSINYRLGVDGFALLPDAPANRGLLDQIAALEWVRDNISAFGGNAANVTIFGESAGAMSVITLLSLPRARGLFTKAIAQSGAAQAAADPADAALVTAELGQALQAVLATSDVTAAGLAGVELDTLIAAQATVRDALGADPNPARFGPSIVASSMPFIPVIDGALIPEHPLAAIAGGAGSTVTLLIGTNTEEFRLFLVPPGTIDLITAEALPFVAAAIGADQRVIERYQANRPGASAGDIFAALVTDKFFRLPALDVAQARSGGPAATYFYEFDWGHPPIGAGHSLEIPFVFDNLATAADDQVIGADPPQDLADEMNSAWVKFATTANPGWPAFDDSRPVRVFDADGGSIEHDLRGDERAIWPAG